MMMEGEFLVLVLDSENPEGAVFNDALTLELQVRCGSSCGLIPKTKPSTPIPLNRVWHLNPKP